MAFQPRTSTVALHGGRIGDLLTAMEAWVFALRFSERRGVTAEAAAEAATRRAGDAWMVHPRQNDDDYRL